MKKFNAMKKNRKGFSLVELLIAVIVLGILSAMLIAAGTASQNKARVSVAMNDIDGLKNATYQALIEHPEIMKYTDTKPTDSFKSIVKAINEQVDEAYQLDWIDGTSSAGTGYKADGLSGAVAETRTLRDPWGKPYVMYIYSDDTTCAYNQQDGTKTLSADNSQVYIVFASAGRNGTGVGMGIDGNNYQAGNNNKIASAAKVVNNTDGIDDLGVIMRIKNGSTTYATFGSSTATLGTLEGVQWVFGPILGTSGIYVDYADAPTTAIDTKGQANTDGTMKEGNVILGGSIDQYANAAAVDAAKDADTGKAVIGQMKTAS